MISVFDLLKVKARLPQQFFYRIILPHRGTARRDLSAVTVGIAREHFPFPVLLFRLQSNFHRVSRFYGFRKKQFSKKSGKQSLGGRGKSLRYIRAQGWRQRANRPAINRQRNFSRFCIRCGQIPAAKRRNPVEFLFFGPIQIKLNFRLLFCFKPFLSKTGCAAITPSFPFPIPEPW